MARPTNITLCSFCGKSHAEVKKLIAGPGVYICDNCIVLCKSVLDKELTAEPKKAAPVQQVPKPAEIKRHLDLHCIGQEQAKKALQFCVENLNEGDRFEVVRFSTEVEPLFDKLVSASKSNREKANEFIKDLKPIGGTAIDDALKRALALKSETGRPFVVIFLTDGQPTIGTTDEGQILADVKRAGEDRTRVFCFGIGMDVNAFFLFLA